MFKSIVLASIVLIGAVSARTSTGNCPAVQLQDKFDATKYTGAWFQVGKDKNSPFENGYCEQARYSINDDGTLKVYNSQYNNETGEIETATGVAVCNGPQCAVKFFWFSPSADYRVVSTDYDSYALVYACNDVFLAKVDYVWLLTREQNPPQSLIDNILQILQERVPEYTHDNISFTYQGPSCKYLTDAEE